MLILSPDFKVHPWTPAVIFVTWKATSTCIEAMNGYIKFHAEDFINTVAPLLKLFKVFNPAEEYTFSEEADIESENINIKDYALFQIDGGDLVISGHRSTDCIFVKLNCDTNLSDCPPFWVEFLPFYQVVSSSQDPIIHLSEKRFYGFSIADGSKEQSFRVIPEFSSDYKFIEAIHGKPQSVCTIHEDLAYYARKEMYPFTGNGYDFVMLNRVSDDLEIAATDGHSIRRVIWKKYSLESQSENPVILPSFFLRWHFHLNETGTIDEILSAEPEPLTLLIELCEFDDWMVIPTNSGIFACRKPVGCKKPLDYNKVFNSFHPTCSFIAKRGEFLSCIDKIIDFHGGKDRVYNGQIVFLHWKNRYLYIHSSYGTNVRIDQFIRLLGSVSEGAMKISLLRLRTLVAVCCSDYVNIAYQEENGSIFPIKYAISDSRDSAGYNIDTLFLSARWADGEIASYDFTESSLLPQVKAYDYNLKTQGLKNGFDDHPRYYFRKPYNSDWVEYNERGIDFVLARKSIDDISIQEWLQQELFIRFDSFYDLVDEKGTTTIVEKELARLGFDTSSRDEDYLRDVLSRYCQVFENTAQISIQTESGAYFSKALFKPDTRYLNDWSHMDEMIGRIIIIDSNTGLIEGIRTFELGDLSDCLYKYVNWWKDLRYIWDYVVSDVHWDLWDEISPTEPSDYVVIPRAEDDI